MSDEICWGCRVKFLFLIKMSTRSCILSQELSGGYHGRTAWRQPVPRNRAWVLHRAIESWSLTWSDPMFRLLISESKSLLVQGSWQISPVWPRASSLSRGGGGGAVAYLVQLGHTSATILVVYASLHSDGSEPVLLNISPPLVSVTCRSLSACAMSIWVDCFQMTRKSRSLQSQREEVHNHRFVYCYLLRYSLFCVLRKTPKTCFLPLRT